MQLTRQEQKQVKAVAQHLKREFGASEILLYGSAVHGNMSAESDIDLLAVLPARNWETEKRIADFCFGVEMDLGRVISVLPIAQDEYRSSAMSFAPIVLNARREGILL